MMTWLPSSRSLPGMSHATCRRLFGGPVGLLAGVLVLGLACALPARGATRDEAVADLRARLPVTLTFEIIPETSFLVSAAADGGLTVTSQPVVEGQVPRGVIELRPEEPELFDLTISGTTDATPYSLKILCRAEKEPAEGKPAFALLMATMIIGEDALQSAEFTMKAGNDIVAEPDWATTCDFAAANRQHLLDIDFVNRISDYFWHNPPPEQPSEGFTIIVRLCERINEIDPRYVDSYTTGAWLLWSQWVSWKQEPANVKDGEGKLDAALELLSKGAKNNPDSAAYHYEAGQILVPVLQYHRPDLRPLVEGYFLRAAELDSESEVGVRNLLALGRLYRKLEEKDKAVSAFRKALAADPANSIARNHLRDLGEEVPELPPGAVAPPPPPEAE